MWISEKVSALEREEGGHQLGEVQNGKEKLVIQANGRYDDVQLLTPWGITYLPPRGVQAVVVQADGTPLCAGVTAKPEGLAAGELMLRAASGAYIHLKNNGEVEINGQVFAAKTV